MRLTYSGTWVLMILVPLFCREILKGTSQSTFSSHQENGSTGKTFVGWYDMIVDFSKLGFTNSSRVIVVDKNGGGHSVTVQGAVDMVPEQNCIRYKIYIRPGIYSEKVHVPKSKPYISFIGEQGKSAETVITWQDKASDSDKYGNMLGTYRSASVTIESNFFCANHVTFQNTVVSLPWRRTMQAVALRLAGDKAWLHKVRILGTQDTLLDESGLHFFDQCFIQGSVDFICGNAKSLFQDCTLHSVATGTGAVAAHRRQSPKEDTGFSFVGCHITGRGKVFLGRAWGIFSRVIYSFCNFDKIVDPKGWDDWKIPARERTVDFGEFHCRGEGANRSQRVPWSRSYSFLQAEFSLTSEFIDGRTWLKPYAPAQLGDDQW